MSEHKPLNYLLYF